MAAGRVLGIVFLVVLPRLIAQYLPPCLSAQETCSACWNSQGRRWERRTICQGSIRLRGGGKSPQDPHKQEIGFLHEQRDLAARRKFFIETETSIGTYLRQKGRESRSKDRQRPGRLTEREEDEALLKEQASKLSDGSRHIESIAARMSELLPIHSQPEILRGGQLRDYQLDGLNWLASLYCNGIGGILADEMGLGKTVQTVAFLGLMMQCGTSGPFLLLVPKSTMGNWQLEVQKWIPTARLLALQGTAQEREELISSEMAAGRFDILLTSYEVFLRHKHAICRVRWRYVAIDEAHRIKNEDSQLAQVARELKTCGRLLITGTPLQNNVHELWALLNFVLPDEFHSSQDFENLFRLDSTTDAAAVTVNLQGILGPFMLRRLKRDVERSLLPKQEINVYIPLSSMQRNLYSHILKKDLSAISGKGGDRSQLLNIVMQLRKACNHPYLFEGQEPGPPYVEGEHLVDNAGKMKALDQLLKKLHANHSRVLLFCQMTRMLDIIEDYCNYRNFTYCRIDGQSVGAERQESIAEFMKEGSDRFLFLLSTRAGGLGLNLQAADKVVLYDSDWNPQADIQAMDRAHRIGQKKQVVVYRFIHEKTIEEKVVERAFQKLFLDAIFIQNGLAKQKDKNSLAKDDLLDMIRFGADSAVHVSTLPDGELDIEALLAASAQKTNEFQKSLSDLSTSFNLSTVTAYDRTKDVFYERSSSKPSSSRNEFYLEIGKRRREHVEGFYNEDDSFRSKIRLADDEKKPKVKSAKVQLKMPRNFSLPSFYEHQLLNVSRISQLYEKRIAAWKAAMAQPTSPNHSIEEILKMGKWTRALQLELDQLLDEGFVSWTMKDFLTFKRALYEFGRNDTEAIAEAMVNKSKEEVERYVSNFFAKGPQAFKGWNATIRNVEQVEEEILQRQKMIEAVRDKIAQYKHPRLQMELSYRKGVDRRPWTDSEDRFLVVTVMEVGYGQWRTVQRRIRSDPEWVFDWFFKSRSASELKSRFKILGRMIERNAADMKALERKRNEEKKGQEEVRAKGAPMNDSMQKSPVKNQAPRSMKRVKKGKRVQKEERKTLKKKKKKKKKLKQSK